MSRRPEQKAPLRSRDVSGMELLRGREFLMGSESFYAEERPIRRAVVGDFWIDKYPVTNRQFAEFVNATGYQTFAEIAPDPKDYPDLPANLARAGSAVFVPTNGPVPLNDPSSWWSFVFGANWRNPLGPGSDIETILDHPVVQISYKDAKAYARWAGKDIPTEAEWEFAARGGLEQAEYAWGEILEPNGDIRAKYWHGEFPWNNAPPDGFERTAPVGNFPPNGYGLFDMIGNVWEWTADWFGQQPAEAGPVCCGPPRVRRADKSESYDPYTPQVKMGRKVVKGGSHLCAANYCQRYRPAARHAQSVDSPTSHIGFRCIIRL